MRIHIEGLDELREQLREARAVDRQAVVEDVLRANHVSEHIVNQTPEGPTRRRSADDIRREIQAVRERVLSEREHVAAWLSLSDDPALSPDAARWTPEDDA